MTASLVISTQGTTDAGVMVCGVGRGVAISAGELLEVLTGWKAEVYEVVGV